MKHLSNNNNEINNSSFKILCSKKNTDLTNFLNVNKSEKLHLSIIFQTTPKLQYSVQN